MPDTDTTLTAHALDEALQEEELAEARRMADFYHGQAESLRRLLKKVQRTLKEHEQRAGGSQAMPEETASVDQKQMARLLEQMGLPCNVSWVQIHRWVESMKSTVAFHGNRWAQVQVALGLKTQTSPEAVLAEIEELVAFRKQAKSGGPPPRESCAWQDHDGLSMPEGLHPETWVEVRLRGGAVDAKKAGAPSRWLWGRPLTFNDIVKWRRLAPAGEEQ